MDLIEILELLELGDLKDEVEEARAKVESQERAVGRLNQQLNKNMKKEHEARSRNDYEEAQRFARLAKRSKDGLRREKEALRKVRDDRDSVEGRVQNLLQDALEEVM